MTKKTLKAKSKSRLMLPQIQTVRLKPPPNPKRQLLPPAKKSKPDRKVRMKPDAKYTHSIEYFYELWEHETY